MTEELLGQEVSILSSIVEAISPQLFDGMDGALGIVPIRLLIFNRSSKSQNSLNKRALNTYTHVRTHTRIHTRALHEAVSPTSPMMKQASHHDLQHGQLP